MRLKLHSLLGIVPTGSIVDPCPVMVSKRNGVVYSSEFLRLRKMFLPFICLFPIFLIVVSVFGVIICLFLRVIVLFNYSGKENEQLTDMRTAKLNRAHKVLLKMGVISFIVVVVFLIFIPLIGGFITAKISGS